VKPQNLNKEIDERYTCRKDCWKCQEQTTHGRAKFLGDQACDCSNQSTESEANGILIPFCLAESRRIDFDLHNYFNRAYQNPNAAANHTGIEQIVTQNALGLWRIKTQLTKEA